MAFILQNYSKINMKNKTSNELFVLNFVQRVSAPQTHAKRLATLRKMMQNCPNDLTMIQWMQLWRGFYYIVWYEEMRKGGEELIIEMGSSDNGSFLMSGFKALAESWNSIDAFRIDKYMFLIRIMLRNCLQKQIQTVHNNNEQQKLFEHEIFLKNYRQSIVNQHRTLEIKADVIDYIISVTSQSIGLFLHICDIYLEELKLIVDEKIDEAARPQIYYELLLPFIQWLALINDDRLLKSMCDNIFNHLAKQTLLNESFIVRRIILKKMYETILNMNGFYSCTTPRNNDYRVKILDHYKQKLDEFDGKTRNKTKRKVVIGLCRKTKRTKYETVTNTPFVRSIVPLPMM